MSYQADTHSALARKAIAQNNWPAVKQHADALLKLDSRSAEAHFLHGQIAKVQKDSGRAISAFERSLRFDASRYDAAIELAWQACAAQQHGLAAKLLREYKGTFSGSPYYQDLAGQVASRIGLHNEAYAFHRAAIALQPEITGFKANLAASSVFAGQLELAEQLYLELLIAHPSHQRFHYQLAYVRQATSHEHLDAMLALLASKPEPAASNIFLYYAIGKESEDLQLWDQAFEYYKLGADAVSAMSSYDVEKDIATIDAVIKTCDHNWLRSAAGPRGEVPRPIFVTGLPRSGTTIVERALSNHSQVQSIGETFFVQAALRAQSLSRKQGGISPKMVLSASKARPAEIARHYLRDVDHLLDNQSPFFVEKLPENFVYLGFLARAFPDATLIALTRNPMDACFSLYKQSYFKFAFNFDDLAAYYAAHHRLLQHWRVVLGERLVEVEYEALVSEPTKQIRDFLRRGNLDVEETCFSFEKSTGAVATASAVQVREKAHTRSVGRWRNFSEQLEPLRSKLEKAGIEL